MEEFLCAYFVQICLSILIVQANKVQESLKKKLNHYTAKKNLAGFIVSY